jgi:hypothetical protein
VSNQTCIKENFFLEGIATGVAPQRNNATQKLKALIEIQLSF